MKPNLQEQNFVTSNFNKMTETNDEEYKFEE